MTLVALLRPGAGLDGAIPPSSIVTRTSDFQPSGVSALAA